MAARPQAYRLYLAVFGMGSKKNGRLVIRHPCRSVYSQLLFDPFKNFLDFLMSLVLLDRKHKNLKCNRDKKNNDYCDSGTMHNLAPYLIVIIFISDFYSYFSASTGLVLAAFNVACFRAYLPYSIS